MSRKLLAALAGFGLMLAAGSAMAAGPVALSGAQMDKVTAGGSLAVSINGAGGLAFGQVFAGTANFTGAYTNTQGPGAAAGGYSFSGSASN